MAYLTPVALTCPGCGHHSPLTWVMGVPRVRDRPGNKGYVKVHRNGDWTVQTTQTETIVSCPVCKTETTRRSLTP